MIDLGYDDEAFLFVQASPEIENQFLNDSVKLEECFLVESADPARNALIKAGRAISFRGKVYALYNSRCHIILLSNGWNMIYEPGYLKMNHYKLLVSWKKTGGSSVEMVLE